MAGDRIKERIFEKILEDRKLNYRWSRPQPWRQAYGRVMENWRTMYLYELSFWPRNWDPSLLLINRRSSCFNGIQHLIGFLSSKIPSKIPSLVRFPSTATMALKVCTCNDIDASRRCIGLIWRILILFIHPSGIDYPGVAMVGSRGSESLPDTWFK